MSIHFNDTWVTTNIVKWLGFYDASASTFTRRGANYDVDNVDLFPDDFAVGDCILIGVNGYSYSQYSGVRFNLDVALAAVSVSGVWEYARRASGTTANWTALAGVTDGTNGFTVTGSQDLTFTCPTDWEEHFNIYSTESYLWWIRYRITAVDTPTEGGHQVSGTQMGARPYAIWCESGTTGTPATFTDVYNADVAGGWGVVTKNANQFTFDCSFRLPATYYLSSQQEQIQFLHNFQTVISGVVRFGALYSGDKCYNGSSFIFHQTNRGGSDANIINADSYMYNSVVRFIQTGAANNGMWGGGVGAFTGQSIIDCYFERIRQISYTYADAVGVGIKSSGQLEGGPLGIFDGGVFFNTPCGWRPSPVNSGMHMHRCDFSKVTSYPLDPYVYGGDNFSWYAVDCNYGTYAATNYVYWISPGTNNKFYTVTSMLLRVVDEDGDPISGATVVLKDKNGTTIFTYTTNADGYVGVDSGSVTSATSTSITDSTKTWTVNQWRWKEFYITSGTGVGQRKICKYHVSATNVLNAHTAFQVTPAAGDEYILIPYINHALHEPITPEGGNCYSTVTDYNPFTLTITMPGYESYESVLTLNKAFDSTITLKTAVDVLMSNLGPGIRLNRENLGPDRELVMFP